ncbi:MAG: T9SS type A sorting domain-containing protein [Ignavibacteria bacterium]|nr:T9SS type A sorting domain-containing protein [Ignavibacteria bacterium]
MNTNVLALAFSEQYLYAGAFFGGVWKMPLSATNIEEREENTTLGLLILTYPNPSEGTLTIEIEDVQASSDIYDVMMYDMYGRQIGIYQIHNKQTIDLNSIPVGQYQLQVRNAQTQSTFAPSIFSIMR